jgi:hypothetical protein
MSNYQFPSIAKSEAEKSKKEYYESWCKAIVSNTFTSNWAVNYNKLKLLYSFFNEGTGSNLTGYLQTAPDGSAMPGIWTSISNVKSRLRTLVGELEERGYAIKARALNPEAIDRKRTERDRLWAERHLQEVLQFAEEQSGLGLQSDEYIPQTDQELDEYMDLNWKDKHVQILEAALKWIAQRTHWDESRKRLFWNVLIANMMVVRNEIVRGVPQARVIDPLKFIFDPNASDDMLSDSTYFGEVEYMPLAVAAERYGLTLKEIEECYKSYQAYLGLGVDSRSASEYTSDFDCMPNQTAKWFIVENGVPRCLIIKACWRDYKTLAHKNEKKEKYNTEYLQNVTGQEVKKKDKDKIIYNKIECWRQATLVGGKFLREYGEYPNQARDISSLEISECPYKVWIPEFFLGRSVSLVEQQVGLSLLKDVAVYQLQIQMARAIGKVIVVDQAYLPPGMTPEQAHSYMKADGIIWVNSKEYQLAVPGAATNLFKDYDIGLSESIGQGIQLIEYLDRQLNEITGIGPERQGQVQGASTAVGVQQSALIQSNLITAPYFRGFERYCSRILNHQAKLVKVSWAGKEIYAPIIGTVGVDFLKENIDISLDEFDVEVQSLPPQSQDRQVLNNWLGIAVQSGELSVADAIDILMEPDLTIAVRKYKRKHALRQAMLQQQEQQQFQAEQQMQQAQLAQQGQLQQGNWQNQLELQGMKNQANLQKTLASSRTKLNSEKLRLLNK